MFATPGYMKAEDRRTVAWPAGGDYSSMRIDPADDCTFWYTNEYEATDGFAGNAACYGLALAPCPDPKTEFFRGALGQVPGGKNAGFLLTLGRAGAASGCVRRWVAGRYLVPTGIT